MKVCDLIRHLTSMPTGYDLAVAVVRGDAVEIVSPVAIGVNYDEGRVVIEAKREGVGAR